jgi:hypothetical protein
MATPTPAFQVLTLAQRSSIMEQWKRPFGLYADWQQAPLDGIEYATGVTIDIIKLLFQQEMIQRLYSSTLFRPVSVRNGWAENIESVPNLIVSVGPYTQFVPELNATGRTDDQLNRYMPERYDIEMRITVEGQNTLDCDTLTAKFSSCLMQFIVPALADLPMPLLAMRRVQTSDASERRRSSTFVTKYRVVSFPVRLDYVPIAATDNNQLLSGILTDVTKT